MALMNVRLDEEDARRVSELRRAGVQISALVRKAIRTEHEQRVKGRPSPRAAAALLARIFADHPDAPDQPRRGFDLRDRRAVRAAVARRGRKSRS